MARQPRRSRRRTERLLTGFRLVEMTMTSLLEEDHALRLALNGRCAGPGTPSIRAAAITLGKGPWAPSKEPPPAGHLGYLLLDGLIVRHTRLAAGRVAELLGPGDVLRPWQEEETCAPVPATSCWRVLEPARLAVLDPAAAAALGRYPELVGELLHRSVRRSRWLSCLVAISDIPRVDIRLLVVLWNLADRFGHVDPDGGVRLPLRLTHDILAATVGARRPSVSRSLGYLVQSGLVVPHAAGGWTLTGDAESALAAVTRVTVPGAARASEG